jgi:hypothetical protein
MVLDDYVEITFTLRSSVLGPFAREILSKSAGEVAQAAPDTFAKHANVSGTQAESLNP